MAWILLIVAGLFEVGWAVGLKYTEGFTRLWPTIWTVGAMVLSLTLLGLALRTLPSGRPMRSGRGSGRSAPRSSASGSSASPRTRCGSSASG
jgi:quaternary ammonium compound-resistance protein SugE